MYTRAMTSSTYDYAVFATDVRNSDPFGTVDAVLVAVDTGIAVHFKRIWPV